MGVNHLGRLARLTKRYRNGTDTAIAAFLIAITLASPGNRIVMS